jgi:hypothetical protein
VFASKSYRNCLEVEELLMGDIRNPKLSAHARAVSVNAFDRILERKRILRMKPAPKPVDADWYQEQRRRTRRAGPRAIRDAKTAAPTLALPQPPKQEF